jgi:hypothetical protein
MNKHSFFILPLAAAALASCSSLPSSSSSGKSISSETKSSSIAQSSSSTEVSSSSTKNSSSSKEASSSSSVSSNSSSNSSSSVDVSDLKWITPTGAPTLAFYDQGSNTANWTSSSSPTTGVVPAFGTSDYDMIVFDGTSGLGVIAKNSYNYQLAQWISGGNFYVVSTKHTSISEFQAGQTIDGFVKTGNASKSFLKLSKDIWKWDYSDTEIAFEDGVAQVKTNLTANPSGHDYYIIAQPVLAAAKKALASQTPAVTLNVVANLQSEWKKAYNQATIPAAALFVNKSSYEKKKDKIDAFMAITQSRQDDAVNAIDKVTSALNAYGDDTAVTARFGFTSALVSALQPTNQFGILKSGDITDKKAFANDFQTTLGASAFADSLFL